VPGPGSYIGPEKLSIKEQQFKILDR